MQSKLRHVSLLWLEGGAFTHHLAQWLKLCTTEHKVSGSILSSGNFFFFHGVEKQGRLCVEVSAYRKIATWTKFIHSRLLWCCLSLVALVHKTWI